MLFCLLYFPPYSLLIGLACRQVPYQILFMPTKWHIYSRSMIISSVISKALSFQMDVNKCVDLLCSPGREHASNVHLVDNEG